MAMTKADIVEALYEKVGFSKKEAADLVELVFDTIKQTLSQGQKIKVSGFGNFVVREKRSRIGRNPQTGRGTGPSHVSFPAWREVRVETNKHALVVYRYHGCADFGRRCQRIGPAAKIEARLHASHEIAACFPGQTVADSPPHPKQLLTLHPGVDLR